MTAQEEQIARLNTLTKVRLAPSKNGVGVFAIRFISMAEKLYLDNMPEVFTLPYSCFGKLFKEVRELILDRWPQVVNGKRFIYPDTRFFAYVNHSDKGRESPARPNYDYQTDTALRDIKKGEEILMDYRTVAGWEKAYPFLQRKKEVK